MARLARYRDRKSIQFWVLVAFLTLVFVTGGGARADIQSLVVLRPAAVLVCSFGCWTLTRAHVRQFRFLFGFMAALLLLTGLQLVPLPPSIWTSLPGRDIVVTIDRVAGLGQVWRPFSMVPAGTWNALYSLLVPLAVLLVGVQLSREERFALLPVFLGLGLLSGLMGLLQVIGPHEGPLYLYRITNDDSAVGLFSNRNHAAVFLACLFPMLAVFASTGVQTIEQSRLRLWIAIIVGVVLIPLILVTGSRAGIILAVIGLGSAALLYRKPAIDRPAKRKTVKIHLRYVFGGFGVVALGLLTAVFSRAKAFERLIAADQAEDLRFRMWGPIAEMAWKYFPLGSGAGSFVEVFQIDEPLALLSPTYVNHAHNDWLEVFLTTGLPGATLLLIAVVVSAIAAFSTWRTPDARRRDIAFARLGSVILLSLALASLSDYPVRVPSIMCLASFAALLLLNRQDERRTRTHPVPNRDGSAAESPLAAKRRI